MSGKRVSVIVQGRVQGVGYRASARRRAQELGLTGWVRNRWDGTVEALLEGAANAVDEMVAWCRVGPPAAGVTDVELAELPPADPQVGFRVRG